MSARRVRAALLCLEPGLATTVQDKGRPGFGHQGLAASGAIDRRALAAANRLAGNEPGAAALEMALMGGSFQVEGARVRVAFAGAALGLMIDDAPASPWRSHRLEPGQVLRIGRSGEGVWAYLAIEGGIDVPIVLGSRSTHGRARIGGIEGRRLQAGDRVPVGSDDGPAGSDHVMERPFAISDEQPVRVVPGPQETHFTKAGLASFIGRIYRIAAAFDRMAMRLEGTPIEHEGSFNIVSDGIVPGSVQVPGNGLPIVMLADHQTTGGYPKIATVISADLPLLAQRRPGSAVRFRPCTVEEADQARLGAAAALQASFASIAPVRDGAPFEPERLLALNLVGGVVDARGEGA